MELTKEKWNNIFHQKSISNRTEAFHLLFHRNFGYITVKWDWKRTFLQMERHVSVGPDPTGQRGPPPVVPNILVGPNRNGPFRLTSARNFTTFCVNGKHPWCPKFTLLISPLPFRLSLFSLESVKLRFEKNGLLAKKEPHESVEILTVFLKKVVWVVTVFSPVGPSPYPTRIY